MGMRDQFINIGPSYFSPPEIAKFVPDLVNNNGSPGIFISNWVLYHRQIQEAQLKTTYSKELVLCSCLVLAWSDCSSHQANDHHSGKRQCNRAGSICRSVQRRRKKYKPMLSCNTITWANNSNLVKMDGGDSIDVHVLVHYDPKTIESTFANKGYTDTTAVATPALLPGCKDIPSGCK